MRICQGVVLVSICNIHWRGGGGLFVGNNKKGGGGLPLHPTMTTESLTAHFSLN